MSAPGYILIVDDDNDLREVMHLTLETHRYEVECASSGYEALEKIARRRPALVLLDLIMPKMSGSDVMRELQKDPRYDELKVVILSACTNVAATCTRATSVLQKPITVEELLATVESIMSASR